MLYDLGMFEGLVMASDLTPNPHEEKTGLPLEWPGWIDNQDLVVCIYSHPVSGRSRVIAMDEFVEMQALDMLFFRLHYWVYYTVGRVKWKLREGVRISFQDLFQQL